MQEPLTLTFAAGADVLHIQITRESDPASSSHGDARLSLTVASAGFAGRANCWADRDALDRFSRAMSGLHERLQGHAELRSISPGELVLSIRPISADGAFAVEGQLCAPVQGKNLVFKHTIGFGFEIETAQIERAAKLLSELTAGTAWSVVEMTRRNDSHL
jgi:hypothetical protein